MASDSKAALATVAPVSEPLPGLIWGYRFNEDGQAEQLDAQAATRALVRQETWIWLHFDLIDGRAREALGNLEILPPEARELLLDLDPRQRMQTYGNVIAGVISDFERADELDPRHMTCWRFCMVPHAFISARRSPLYTMAEMNEAVQAGKRFADVLHLFDSIVHSFADALSTVAHQMAEQLNEVEDGLLDTHETGDFKALGSIRRKAVRLRRQATPLQSMLHRLITQRPDWFTDSAADDCTQLAHRVDSVSADLGALQERAHALVDELDSRQTALTNRRLMLLSVVSAVLLPPTLISGIFGMNVDGLPLKDNSPWGFDITMAVMIGSVLLLLWILRRMRMF